MNLAAELWRNELSGRISVKLCQLTQLYTSHSLPKCNWQEFSSDCVSLLDLPSLLSLWNGNVLIDYSSGRNISSLSKLLLNHSQYAEWISHAEQRALLFSIFLLQKRKEENIRLVSQREQKMENSLIIILGENNFTADKNKTQTKNFIASKLLILLPKRGELRKLSVYCLYWKHYCILDILKVISKNKKTKKFYMHVLRVWKEFSTYILFIRGH